jgi:hypothetical protein
MKTLLRVFIGLVLLLVIVGVLLFSPAVQTWAARRATSGQDIAIGRVAVGLSATRLDHVRVAQPGMVFTLPSAEVEMALASAASGDVNIKRLVAKGWILDLTPASSAASSSLNASPASSKTAPAAAVDRAEKSLATEKARTAFEGVFKSLRLPVDLALNGVELEGDVITPEGRTHVVVTGGGVGAGREGVLALKAEVVAGASSVAVRGDLAVRMDSPRTLDRVVLKVGVNATGPSFPSGLPFQLILDAARQVDSSEAYTVAVLVGEKPLFNLAAAMPAGAAPLTGTWKIDARDADLAPFAAGRALPTLTATGQGSFTADRLFNEIQASGQLTADLDRLAVLEPALAALGAVHLNAEFDVAQIGKLTRVRKLSARLDGAQPVASLAALQPFDFDAATAALKLTDPASGLLRINLQALPLSWVAPFLPAGLVVTGDDVRGEWLAAAQADGGFALKPVQPLKLTQLNVTQAGRPLVRALDLTLRATADYTPKGWTAEINEFNAASAGAPVLTVSAQAAQLNAPDQPLKLTGRYEVNLPTLLAQPVAAESASLAQGVARGDFTATVAATKQATFTLQLADLVATPGAMPLPTVVLTARADIAADGRIDASFPLVITRGSRRSDLMFAAVVTTLPAGQSIAAKLTGDALYVEDLQAFAALAPATAPAPVPASKPVAPRSPTRTSPSTGTTTPTAPATAVWAGLNGELQLALKKIIYTTDFTATDLTGVVKIGPTAIMLEDLRGVLGLSGALKASGGLRFEAQAPAPYALQADFAVTQLDVAALLRAVQPGKDPVVEGKFDLTTRLAGRATTPAGFTDTALGDINLTSRNGVVRALTSKNATVAKRAGQAAALVGLFGQLSGDTRTTQAAAQAAAAAEVARELGNLAYDQLNLVLARDAEANLAIKDLTLKSPSISLTGTGRITQQPGVPLLRQPLLLTLQLGAKQRLADNLYTLKLLAPTTDPLAYAPLTEALTFDGTLQAIGTKQLDNLLRRVINN